MRFFPLWMRALATALPYLRSRISQLQSVVHYSRFYLRKHSSIECPATFPHYDIFISFFSLPDQCAWPFEQLVASVVLSLSVMSLCLSVSHCLSVCLSYLSRHLSVSFPFNMPPPPPLQPLPPSLSPAIVRWRSPPKRALAAATSSSAPRRRKP